MRSTSTHGLGGPRRNGNWIGLISTLARVTARSAGLRRTGTGRRHPGHHTQIRTDPGGVEAAQGNSKGPIVPERCDPAGIDRDFFPAPGGSNRQPDFEARYEAILPAVETGAFKPAKQKKILACVLTSITLSKLFMNHPLSDQIREAGYETLFLLGGCLALSIHPTQRNANRMLQEIPVSPAAETQSLAPAAGSGPAATNRLLAESTITFNPSSVLAPRRLIRPRAIPAPTGAVARSPEPWLGDSSERTFPSSDRSAGERGPVIPVSPQPLRSSDIPCRSSHRPAPPKS